MKASRNARETSAATRDPIARAATNEIEDLIERSLALMTRRQRWELRAKWALRGFAATLYRRLPGYRSVSLACWRMQRQGLSGLWTPLYDAYRQPTGADRRMPWHGWAVLAEDGGYRAYTPTRRTPVLETPEFARAALLNTYGRGDRSGFAWEPLPPARERKRHSSPPSSERASSRDHASPPEDA